MDIRVLNQTPLHDVREAIFTTLGKDVPYRPFSESTLLDYWVNLFIQKHSVIRCLTIRVSMKDCRADVCRQLIRATKGHPQPYVQSSRPDWTGVPRSSDSAQRIRLVMDFTPEAFMAMANQRLCTRAMKETRETVQAMVKAMTLSDDCILQALALCSVPNCVYQGGCPEGNFDCGWYGRQESLLDSQKVLDRYFEHFRENVLDEESRAELDRICNSE